MTDQPSLFEQKPEPKRVFDFAAANEARERDKRRPTPAPTAKQTLTSMVLGELALGCGSDRQIAERLEAKGLLRAAESVRKRRKELEDGGFVRFSGSFTTNRLGNDERIYEITYEGQIRAGVAGEDAA